MIGRIAGRIDYIDSDHVLIDVSGVGYLVYCSNRTLAQLPSAGESVALYTDLLVREDNLQLFGFATLQDKAWHQLLVSVQGVGAKAALAIIGSLGTDALSRAITLGDVPSIQSAPGVGPKLAQRIATELKDKTPAMMAVGTPSHAPAPATAYGDIPVLETYESGVPAQVQAEALSALSNLGYTQSDAAKLLAKLAGDMDETTDTQTLIKAALRALSPDAS